MNLPRCATVPVALTAAVTMVVLAVAAVVSPAGAAPHGYRLTVDLTFPTVPSAHFADDFYVPRGDDDAHGAIDLFAPVGTPVYAARGGQVTWAANHPTAGWALHVRGDDGRTYAYYHLGPHDGDRSEAIATGVDEGVTVAQGQLIGFIGDSGNAVGGPPHLHFEIHDEAITDPFGRNRINPEPSLRAALARGAHPPQQAAAPLLRLGSRGPHVAAWQRELNAHGQASLSEDGMYGPQTLQATRQLQQTQGVGVDGIVGPQTRAASAAALSGPGAGIPVLREGQRGPRVAEWQQQLNAALPTAVTVDGLFGPQTQQATRQLQQAHGIAVDGVVGPQSRQAMFDALR